ncbi:GTP cyclohydrolase II [Acuticoccus sediminis]|uniref:GTP cyclohydrolase II n=1 Tax=Acuticoccus sediminis TaxID=2184697 RepID=A0A8B2NR63_9HYPH|nr:GTP cyclohydrolase II [Acuticoccus sediminis]RAH99822.1 GTP cyclohydrolase II [Acuticoccus sediminis]
MIRTLGPNLSAPHLSANDPGFIAVHRAIGEIAAGRPVIIRDGLQAVLASPIDGGPILSGRMTLTAARAGYLGLEPAPTVVEAEPDRAVLSAIAMADAADVGRHMRAGSIANAASELAKMAERVPAMTLGSASSAPPGTLAAHAGDVLSFRHALAATQRPIASAPVPLAAGATANVTAFRNAIGGTVTAVVVGDIDRGALVRVHSACVTGDILGSLKCDCGAQLRLALGRICSEGGIVLYTAQEGRGIGLANKLRAYALQDKGLDTVDANIALGFHDDERDYAAAGNVLAQLGLSSIRLMTNNPTKAAGLATQGISVEPVPLIGPVTPDNERYLATKKTRSGHHL